MPAPPDSLRRFVRERPLHYLWGLAADLGIAIFTAVLGPPAVVGALITRRSWPVDLVGPIWCGLIVRICGILVEIEGRENLRPGRSYVVICNHLSNFDIWCTLASLDAAIRFVAKKELLRVPVFGQVLAVSDHIIIDRQRPGEAIRRINAAAERSRKGMCILFYAEGTRSPDGKVHEFKKGGVTLALRAQLPVVPMSISGTRKFLPKGCVVIRPSGRVKIVIDTPIDTAGMSIDDRDALNERVRQRVIANYVEHY